MLRKYLTTKLLRDAKAHVEVGEVPYEYTFSPTITIIFGTVGLSVKKYYDHREYHKHINYWQEKTAAAINQEIYDQEWMRWNAQ